MLWRMPADLRRERIGMMFIDIDASRGAARSSSAACTTRSAFSRLIHGHQMTGGKGGKGGNPFPPVCSPNTRPYSGTKEFPVAAARPRAISCRSPLDRVDPVSGDRQNRVRELRKLALTQRVRSKPVSVVSATPARPFSPCGSLTLTRPAAKYSNVITI